ncbi:hypothetical protein GOODEAATRI_016158 [Goodea atripinnis]|uniref:Uncharacterized protein n=1 Tax=Goodea atripinnis TaxID=208336 RepID=A0ABV0P4J4_9TELE
MTTLRTFGLAKGSMEENICQESRHLQEAMEKEEGKPFDPVPLLNNAVSNIICQIVFGRRFDYSDQDLQAMLKNLADMAYLEGSIWALEEIDRVVGQTRQPTMEDRSNMPYTDAVIHEIQRMGNIVPLNGLRMTARDTTLGGYFIPKGTTVMPNLTSVLFDKNEWETPDSFNPKHFLDDDGRFMKKEAFLPFSAGNNCI